MLLNWPNLVVGLVGLVLTPTGLLFWRDQIFAAPVTGLGASVLATAIVNWILQRRLNFFPLASIVEALAQNVKYM